MCFVPIAEIVMHVFIHVIRLHLNQQNVIDTMQPDIGMVEIQCDERILIDDALHWLK